MRKKFRTILLSLLLAMGSCLAAIAQTRIVTGTVVEQTDAGPEPITGVNVVVKGTMVGAVTDLDGNYSIQVPEGGTTLVFSFIGFDSQEVSLAGRSTIDVVMASTSQLLDDVVVVGYGVQKRSDLAGSVSSIKSDELQSYPSTGVAEMMRGKAAGVQITTSSGAPGSYSNIQIRGSRSLNDGSNEPMYVIDGVSASAEEFNAVSPDDVESLEILKDAASQAIYGARAANGVIIITTKRGKTDKPVITFNTTLSQQRLWKNFDFYNAEEFFQLRREGIAADFGFGKDPATYAQELATLTVGDVLGDQVWEDMYNAGKSTDWESLMFQQSLMQKYELSVRGGSKQLKYAASAGWLDQDGIVKIGSRYKRANFRLNTDYEATRWLTISVSSSYIKSSNLAAPSGFTSYITKSPLGTPYEDDGVTLRQYTSSGTDTNPLYNAQYTKNETTQDISRLVGSIDIHPIKGLSYKLNLGYYNSYVERANYRKAEITDGSAGSITATKQFHYTVENILNYQVPFKNKDFSLYLTAVQGYEHDVASSIGFGANNVPVDSYWWNMLADGVNTSMTRTLSEYYLLSYLGRAQFAYKGRYLMNVAVRRDGSSRFGKNKKWGNFPSISLAWRVSDEPWMKKYDFVSNLKLRASYGLVGNQNGISNYETLGTVSSNDYQFGDNYIMGYSPQTSLPNINLRWEKTASTNLAVDFGFINNRINGTVEYYRTTTSDLLFNRTINSVLGYTNMTDNVAKTRTYGLDINLEGAIIRSKKVDWTLGGTFSLSRNKIVALSGERDADGNLVDDPVNRWFIDEPINVLYDYKVLGIYQYDDFEGYDETENKWIPKMTEDTDGDGVVDAVLERSDPPAPGRVKVEDVNGDHKITADDRILYKRDPKFIASWNTSLRVDNFDLSMDWYARVGGQDLNPYLHKSDYGGSLQGKRNGIKVDYWTPLNPNGKFQRPSPNATVNYSNMLALQDLTYVRLRTLSLGYSLPKKILRPLFVSSAKITLTATNLLTFTDYLSYSPETDAGTYPEARQYSATFSITF